MAEKHTSPVATLGELFDLLGGVTKLSHGLGVPIGTASAWKTRGQLPAEHWRCVIELAAALDPPVKITTQNIYDLCFPTGRAP